MMAALGHLSEYWPVWKNTRGQSQYWFDGYRKICICSLLWETEQSKTPLGDKNDHLKTIANPAC